MAGGRFIPGQEEIRPGIYFHIETTGADRQKSNTTGIVLIPFLKHTWGKKGVCEINCDSPDANYAELGFSVFDRTDLQMLCIKEALKNARKVITYNVTDDGDKAACSPDIGDANLTITAKYAGSRGNVIKVDSVEIPSENETPKKYTVNVYFDNSVVETYANISDVSELVDKPSNYVTFTGSGVLSAFSAVTLENGKDGEATANEFSEFLNEAEKLVWNTVALPIEYSEITSGIFAALTTKIKYLNERAGKIRRAYVHKANADYEQIVSVINGVILDDGTEIPAHVAVAYEAGRDAAAVATDSFTEKAYENAVGVLNPLTHKEAEEANKNGKFFYSVDDDNTVVSEYDINSFVSTTEKKNRVFKKNRVVRTINAVLAAIKNEFKAGKYDNDENGWNIADGMGASILSDYEEIGALKNVDTASDFAIDRAKSDGESMYINVAIQPVDSADKIYITVKVS